MVARIAFRRRSLALALACCLGLACDNGEAPDHNHIVPPDGGTCGHVDNASGLVLVSHGTTLLRLVGFNFDEQYPSQLTVPVGGVLHGVAVTFMDNQQQLIEIANDCTINELGYEITNPSVAEVSQDPGLRWFINITGKRAGDTVLRLSLRHDTHAHYTSQDIPIHVEGPTD